MIHIPSSPGGDLELRINGETREFDKALLSDIIIESNLNPSRVAVELNGKIIPRADFKTTMLKDGDSLEIVHFVGGGSDLQTIKDLTNELDLNDRVVFHGHCSVEKVVDYYEYADVCILSLSSRSLTGETIPGKLTGYMAAGRPIIAAINGISKTIIEDARCGYVCQADDVDALAALMQKVADDPECLASLGKNGREYFNKHFTLEMHMNGLLAWLEELVNRGNVREER